MKQKDIALIAVAVLFGVIFSVVLSNLVFASPKNRQQKVEVVQPITDDFPAPDNHYFNDQSFDPTQLITIGNNTNPTPFNGTQSQ